MRLLFLYRHDVYSWGKQDIHWQPSKLWKNGMYDIFEMKILKNLPIHLFKSEPSAMTFRARESEGKTKSWEK